MLCRQGSQKRCSGRQLLLSGMKFTGLANALQRDALKDSAAARLRLGLASVSPPLAAGSLSFAEAALLRRRYAVMKDARPTPAADESATRGVSPPRGSAH